MGHAERGGEIEVPGKFRYSGTIDFFLHRGRAEAAAVKKKMLSKVRVIARRAGDEILRHYHTEVPVDIDYKADDSPLTQADRASHEIIVAALRELTPDIPVVSEESEAHEAKNRLEWKRFWLVDPLDGTKEFIKKTGDFTVNIALIEDREPVLGVVRAPAIGVEYYAERGKTAYVHRDHDNALAIRICRANPAKLWIVASKDHAGPKVAAMLEKIPHAEVTSMGSSLKFCLIAEGKADIYPRFVPTMEWDTAAAQCIVEAAGGKVMTLDGNRLTYQKPDPRNPAIIAVGDPELDWQQFLPDFPGR